MEEEEMNGTENFEARIKEHLEARAASGAWARHLALIALAALGATAYFVWRARHPEAPAEKDKAAAAASVDLSKLRNRSETFLPDPAPTALPEPRPLPALPALPAPAATERPEGELLAMAGPAPAPAALDGPSHAPALKELEAAESLVAPSAGQEFAALPLPPAAPAENALNLPPERDALAVATADGLKAAPARPPLPGAATLGASAAAPAAAPVAGGAGETFHVIGEDDSLPDIAARYYGSASGENIRRLREANPCLKAGGFRAGVRLRVPAPMGKAAGAQTLAARPAASGIAAPAPSRATAPEKTPAAATCTVRPGDTLSRIAARHYGRPAAWKEIYALNRDQLPTPEALRPGMVLRLPPEP